MEASDRGEYLLNARGRHLNGNGFRKTPRSSRGVFKSPPQGILWQLQSTKTDRSISRDQGAQQRAACSPSIHLRLRGDFRSCRSADPATDRTVLDLLVLSSLPALLPTLREVAMVRAPDVRGRDSSLDGADIG